MQGCKSAWHRKYFIKSLCSWELEFASKLLVKYIYYTLSKKGFYEH